LPNPFELSNNGIDQNELAYVVRDRFPATEGHTLVTPKRHVADYLGLLQPELNAVIFLLKRRQEQIRAEDSSAAGFNVGLNCGAAGRPNGFTLPRPPDSPTGRGCRESRGACGTSSRGRGLARRSKAEARAEGNRNFVPAQVPSRHLVGRIEDGAVPSGTPYFDGRMAGISGTVSPGGAGVWT
jgi:HIT domain